MNTLVVEDDPSAQLILRRILSNLGHEVTVAPSAEVAMQHVGTQFYPLIILDLMLPGMNGIEFCRWLRTQSDAPRQYVLVGTAASSSEALQEILDAGANDYVTKPYSASLLRIRLAIAEAQIRVLEQRKTLEGELRLLARTDPLTRLANRTCLDACLATTVARATPSSPSALLYIDLDNFKIVNDTLGHAAGDRLLVSIAEELKRSVRPADTIARFGGDEFVIILDNLPFSSAQDLANRLCHLLDHMVFQEGNRTFPVGASIGLIAIDGRMPPDQIIAGADSACYRAKAKGRNRVEVHQGGEGDVEALRTDVNWRTFIRDGLRDDRFILMAQPVLEICSGRTAFREALLRLAGQGGGLVGPDVFLPAARRFQLMTDIDRRVIQLTLNHLRRPGTGVLSINLSVESLADTAFTSLLEQTFFAADVEPGRVILEISEQGIIDNFSRARHAIESMRSLGFRVALDDFGAGFSSLKHLRHLPLDLLKIDGAFIRGLPRDPKNQILVRALTDMAHQLAVRTVAEYVDNQETLALLRDLGVDYAQGEFLAMPGFLDS